MMIATASTPGPDVLAATDHEVILRGQQYFDATDEMIDCVIHVSRALYLVAVSDWLDQKAAYFQIYQEYCGTGEILFEQLTRRPGMAYLRLNDGAIAHVAAYDAAAFNIDMELG